MDKKSKSSQGLGSVQLDDAKGAISMLLADDVVLLALLDHYLHFAHRWFTRSWFLYSKRWNTLRGKHLPQREKISSLLNYLVVGYCYLRRVPWFFCSIKLSSVSTEVLGDYYSCWAGDDSSLRRDVCLTLWIKMYFVSLLEELLQPECVHFHTTARKQVFEQLMFHHVSMTVTWKSWVGDCFYTSISIFIYSFIYKCILISDYYVHNVAKWE